MAIPWHSLLPSLAVFWWEHIYLDICFHSTWLMGHPAHGKCVVWDNFSAPRALCTPVYVIAWEKWALSLPGILATTHPCSLQAKDAAGSPSLLSFNTGDVFVVNCGWFHHLHPASVCHFISDKNITGHPSVIALAASFIAHHLCKTRKRNIF